MSIVIRKTEAAEAVSFVQRVYQEEGRLGFSETADSSFRSFLDEHGSDLAWLGAYLAERLIGAVGYDPETYHLALLFVDEAHQKHGVGKALVLQLIEDAAEDGIQIVSVNALEQAVPFYEAIGFMKEGDGIIASDMKMRHMEYLTGERNLGRKVKVIIDQPYGSFHPILPDVVYRCNFGYTEESLHQKDLQEAYVYGPEEPLETFTGTVIAIIYHRYKESTRWIVSDRLVFNRDDVINAVIETEQDYEIMISWLEQS
jgi:GNAT superfamily N-acetyltransferase